MQTVQHEQPNINNIFNQIENFYALVSDKSWCTNSRLIPICLNQSFTTLVQLFSVYGGINYRVEYTKAVAGKIPAIPGKKILVCFSGGKDSTATAIYYKQKGYNVTLYHLKGINKTYKDEYKNCQTIAAALKLPLVIEEVTLTGNHAYIEHPMKNMIIANSALQYGLRNKLTTKIAFGNFTTSLLRNEPFDVCAGDCYEMWRAYEQIIRTYIKGFKIYTPFESMQDTWDIILCKPDIAVLCQSCIGPYRYRKYLHDNNVKKYGVKLPENRCGSCWKCCLEYCTYCDNGIYEYNEQYYKHCMKILQKTLYEETKIKYNIDDVWNHYFFYDRSMSKWVA